MNGQVDLIREAFHYQSRFAGSAMVFKIDFPLTEDPGFPILMQDLALLVKTGFRIVIVPGAKEWIDEVLKENRIVSTYVGDNRLTTTSAIRFVEMAAFHVATRFMTGLSADRVDAVAGNFVRALGLGVIDGVDMEHTGRVEKIYVESISRILNFGMVPILPCIGWSPAGKPYNVSSDEIALAVSAALGAAKLFIVSAHEGILSARYMLPENVSLGEDGRAMRLTPQEAAQILETAKKTGEESPRLSDPVVDKGLSELRLALRASQAGVERVHIIDGRQSGAILRELFSNLGAGTMIYADEYEFIRPLKTADIPAVLRIMEPLMQRGNLIRRNAGDIQEKKEDYAVFVVDGSVHACGALHDWGESQGEIAAIATDPAYTDLGLGRRVVRYLIERALSRAFRRVFLLTVNAHDWFESLGFRESSLESLPLEKRKTYDRVRKSKIFALDLAQYRKN